MPTLELVTGVMAAGLAGGLTETGQRAARGAWDRLASLIGRRDSLPGDAEPVTGAGEGSTPADEPVRAARPGTYNVVVNAGKGIACGDNISQSNYFH
ncbi:hypothetical protein [Streptomyces qinzhouensis]|uniref:Uncharacterized protein n=1 Tax=Streptomyces qinzhouensis TaxID=2599401 RepID=A0A5B8IRW1_9ACTN|nr:hypothetical protein [Streptomyces qinzhouensis]QDY80389.1 hypothetical protein FQU76_32100 [Streptomyces qinzhouensis]